MTLADHRAIEAEGERVCGAAPTLPGLPAGGFSGQRVADYILESQPDLCRVLKHDGLLDLVRYDLASAAWEGYMAGLRAVRGSA
jgi:hypothetical protein